MKKTTLTLLTAMTVAMTGCASSGVKIEDGKIETLQENITTKTEVLETFGKPTTTLKRSDGGTTLVYTHTKARVKGVTFIPIVGLFSGGTNAEVNNVILKFDNKDILTSYETTASEQDISTGLISN